MTAALDLTPLSATEAERLADLEVNIAAGLEQFYVVGYALMAIRDERLYREAADSFEAYLEGRWNITRSRGYQLIDAAQGAEGLPPDLRPSVESHARALARLPFDWKVAIAEMAHQLGDGKPTEATYRSLAAVAKGIMRTGAIDDGTGEMREWSALSPGERLALVSANLTEETYERMQRQREHIRASRDGEDGVWLSRAQYDALVALAGWAPERERAAYAKAWGAS